MAKGDGRKMPPVREESDPLNGDEPSYLAVVCADLHLCHRPPIARSVEKDWYAVQERYLRQLDRIADTANGKLDRLPILCAGDVFDRPTPPPELIHFALRHLPVMYAVPGQHDLLHHSYKDLRKTAFGVLVQAGKIALLEPGKPTTVIGNTPLTVRGFPWGFEPKPLDRPHDLSLEVAVIHRYLWKPHHGHPEATKETRLDCTASSLVGYDVAVFGDNHIPFSGKTASDCRVWNCGGFMRRRSDEKTHKPSVGLLRSDGAWERRFLDVSKDRFLEDDPHGPKTPTDSQAFLEELASLNDVSLDFREAVRHALDAARVSERLRRYVLGAMEDGK